MLIAVGGCSLPLVGACCCWWVLVAVGGCLLLLVGACCCWWVLVAVGGHSSLLVGGLMVVVGPCGWWWFCLSLLVGSGNGPLLSFVSSASSLCCLSMCCHCLLLSSIGGVVSLLVLLPGCVDDDGRQIVHHLSFDCHVTICDVAPARCSFTCWGWLHAVARLFMLLWCVVVVVGHR